MSSCSLSSIAIVWPFGEIGVAQTAGRIANADAVCPSDDVWGCGIRYDDINIQDIKNPTSTNLHPKTKSPIQDLQEGLSSLTEKT